jgi:hypothetical protein
MLCWIVGMRGSRSVGVRYLAFDLSSRLQLHLGGHRAPMDIGGQHTQQTVLCRSHHGDRALPDGPRSLRADSRVMCATVAAALAASTARATARTTIVAAAATLIAAAV